MGLIDRLCEINSHIVCRWLWGSQTDCVRFAGCLYETYKCVWDIQSVWDTQSVWDNSLYSLVWDTQSLWDTQKLWGKSWISLSNSNNMVFAASVVSLFKRAWFLSTKTPFRRICLLKCPIILRENPFSSCLFAQEPCFSPWTSLCSRRKIPPWRYPVVTNVVEYF